MLGSCSVQVSAAYPESLNVFHHRSLEPFLHERLKLLQKHRRPSLWVTRGRHQDQRTATHPVSSHSSPQGGATRRLPDRQTAAASEGAGIAPHSARGGCSGLISAHHSGKFIFSSLALYSIYSFVSSSFLFLHSHIFTLDLYLFILRFSIHRFCPPPVTVCVEIYMKRGSFMLQSHLVTGGGQKRHSDRCVYIYNQ